MKGIQDTSSETFRQLLGNGLTYEIPKFQRDYSWDTEQWDELWQDIQVVKSEQEPAHYMGYLVIQTENNKTFRVIDGQQRMITLSILILAVLKALNNLVEHGTDANNNQTRITSLRNSYIGYLDPVSLVPRNKLKLNRNNDDFYRQKLVPLLPLPQRGLNTSERLMKNCFNWFYEKVKSTYLTGEALAGFVDFIVDKLFFTVITVGDDLNAFRVFETLNARGVQLSSADLLKNYLFSVVDASAPHETEISEMESLWGRVIGKLGSEKFPEFLRIYWNSKNRTVRKNDLFKAIRRSIRTKQEAFSLIRELDENTDIYVALRDPNDETWTGKKDVANHLMELKLFQVRQPFSLLLAAYQSLEEDRFLKTLKACAIISFRYNIIGGLNPNEQEKVYNETALKIREQAQFQLSWLSEVYVPDNSFVTEFSNKSFKRTGRNHKIVKYILAKIEKNAYRSNIDVFSDTYSIEHILPENPGNAWDAFPDDAIERIVYRLGNLTLLETNANRDIGNESYDAKKQAYADSSLGLTKAIPKYYPVWNEDKVNQRQGRLATEANTIWRLQFN